MKKVVYIDTKDRKGLVNDITGVFTKWDLNITSNDEFVDKKLKRFFMRTEVVGEADAATISQDLSTILPEGSTLKLIPKHKKNIVVLVTRESHCIGELLMRSFADQLNANILGVVANNEKLRSLVERFDLPFVNVPHEDISREEHERRILAEIGKFKPEYLVLAKYMRVLSPNFVAAYPFRTINIHHSFLPAFIGANPYKQAYARGVKIIGATSHFVTDNLDEGPIIVQKVVHVDHSHSARDMSLAGRDVEKIVLATALKLVFEDRVFIYGNKTIIFD